MKWSVSELEKTPEGRKKLDKEREKYKLDILQPGDPMFDKVWGDKVRRNKEGQDKKRRESQEYILEREARKKHAQS